MATDNVWQIPHEALIARFLRRRVEKSYFIYVCIYIALKVDIELGSTAAETPVKYHGGDFILISRHHDFHTSRVNFTDIDLLSLGHK